MNGTRFLLAVAASGVVASFTDWFFMGVMFHGKYLVTPEIWRKKPLESETKYILSAEVVGVLSSAALIYLSFWTGALGSNSIAVRVAVLAWVAGPLPLISMNVIWMKLHPLVGVAHACGWLARFLVTVILGAWILP